MMLVDVERGRTEGMALARELEELARLGGGAEDEDSNLSQEVRDGLDESYSYQRS
jgi:UMF1 family MFS transporter